MQPYTEEIVESPPSQSCVRELVGVGQQGAPGIDGADVIFSNNLTILPGDNGADGADVIGEPGINGQNQDQPYNNFNGKNGQNSSNSPNGAIGLQGAGAGIRDYAIINVTAGSMQVQSFRNILVTPLTFTVATSGRYRVTVNYQAVASLTISINGVNRAFTVAVPGAYQATAIFNLDLIGGVPIPVVVPNGRITILAI